MTTHWKLAGWLLCGLSLIAARASAQTDEPTIDVTYIAPPECATADAFQELVRAEVIGQPIPDRSWRWSVTIRRDADFVGTLRSEGGARELRASTCDEITAALAMIIATAQPERAATPPPLLLLPVVPVAPLAAREPVVALPRDETRMASPARLGIGIAMSAVGVATGSFGVWRLVNDHSTTGACPGAVACQRGTDVTDLGIIGAGAGLLVGGVVMSVLGLQREHVAVEGPAGSTGVTVMGNF